MHKTTVCPAESKHGEIVSTDRNNRSNPESLLLD